MHFLGTFAVSFRRLFPSLLPSYARFYRLFFHTPTNASMSNTNCLRFSHYIHLHYITFNRFSKLFYLTTVQNLEYHFNK